MVSMARYHGQQVSIRQLVLDELIAHAREEAPNECCGLLIGTGEVIEQAVRARNVHGSPTRYLIDPRDQFAAIRSARANGREVLGAYHSHPTSRAVPSPTDLAEAAYPDYLYVIVALAPRGTGTEIRAYGLATGSFVEVSLTTTCSR